MAGASSEAGCDKIREMLAKNKTVCRGGGESKRRGRGQAASVTPNPKRQRTDFYFTTSSLIAPAPSPSLIRSLPSEVVTL